MQVQFKPAPKEFRAWNIDTQQWNIAASYNVKGGVIISRPEVEQIIVQYTCFNDSKGTKIFEGDILRHKVQVFMDDKFVEVWYFFVVMAMESGDYWATTMYTDNHDTPTSLSAGVWSTYKELEVVGNIFQNKEMIDEIANSHRQFKTV